jgi:hypothetical protein
MHDHLTEANLAVLVTPAEDLRGVWVAHCLNLDLVTQGNSIPHAIEMVREAILEVVRDDLARGLDPLGGRTAAPPEAWALMDTVFRSARPLTSVDETRVVAAVGFVKVQIARAPLREHVLPPAEEPEAELSPPAWMFAELGELRNSQRFPY